MLFGFYFVRRCLSIRRLKLKTKSAKRNIFDFAMFPSRHYLADSLRLSGFFTPKKKKEVKEQHET